MPTKLVVYMTSHSGFNKRDLELVTHMGSYLARNLEKPGSLSKRARKIEYCENNLLKHDVADIPEEIAHFLMINVNG